MASSSGTPFQREGIHDPFRPLNLQNLPELYTRRVLNWGFFTPKIAVGTGFLRIVGGA